MGTNIVITMAGRGSRFYTAGYTVPKYEIIAHGRSLFDWSLLSLRNFITPESRLIFVTLESNASAEYVRARCAALDIQDFHIIELAAVTDGQATTAMQASNTWRKDQPLLIYNIDTFVEPKALRPTDIRPQSDGWIPCFSASGDHWSFVELSDDKWAVRVTEKMRISDHASIGLYWFARAADYEIAYNDYFSNADNLVKGEKYVAPLYNHLINQGLNISIQDVPISDVHVLGTPDELAQFLARECPKME